MKYLISLIFFVGTVAQASGIVTIDGTSYGKTDKVFKLESKGQIFTIKKTDLTISQRKALEDLKWGASTSITIPLTAVASVDDAPPKKTK
jgi:hypothetical protein